MSGGERELAAGPLSKDVSFRLIVSGQVGAKEIDRLIRRLQLDKEFLTDNEDEESLAARLAEAEKVVTALEEPTPEQKERRT